MSADPRDGARPALPSFLAFVVIFAASATAAGSPGNQPVDTDEFGRLLHVEGKREIPCPAQDETTAVLLLIGQSNSSNSAERYYQSEHGNAVVNFVDGACYIASSPLLGAQGTAGESWTALGNKLVEGAVFSRVILVPAGIGGSSVDRWQTGGDLNSMLMSVLTHVQRRYAVTHVLWHQGERDYRIGTSRKSYTKSFRSLSQSLRACRVDAPIFVSVATRCNNAKWTRNNQIADAQRSLPNVSQNVLPGVDTDTLIRKAERSDGCHFNASGQEKFAAAWVQLIRMNNKPHDTHSTVPVRACTTP